MRWRYCFVLFPFPLLFLKFFLCYLSLFFLPDLILFQGFSGAGVVIQNSGVVMKNCVMEDNNSPDTNGAGLAVSGSTLYVISSEFRRNLCSNCRGGGLAVSGGLVEVSHTLFERNSAIDGGAVFADNTGTFYTSFLNYVIDFSHLDLFCVFFILMLTVEITFHNCTYKDNEASGSGGAIYLITETDLILSECSVSPILLFSVFSFFLLILFFISSF